MVAIGTRQQHVADGSAVTFAEGVEGVFAEQCGESGGVAWGLLPYRLASRIMKRIMVLGLRHIDHKVGQSPWRLVVEEVVEDDLHVGFSGFDDDLDGIETGASYLEEIVECAYLLDAKHLGENTGKELSHLPFGSHEVDAALQFGDGQRLAVDFPVGCHLHGVKAHIGIGPDWLSKGLPRPTKRKAVVSFKFFEKDTPLLRSGMMEPVVLQKLEADSAQP